MEPTIQVYKSRPEGFVCHLEVASIYVQIENRILFLQIANKLEKGSWGVPAGKVERNETSLDAAKRELFEETGIVIESSALRSLGKAYMCKPQMHYIYHIFGLSLEAAPKLSLSREHCAHAWVSREEALALPLMEGARQALDFYYENNYSGCL